MIPEFDEPKAMGNVLANITFTHQLTSLVSVRMFDYNDGWAACITTSVGWPRRTEAARKRGGAVLNSKQIAGLVGPTLIAVLVSEFPVVQPHLYDAQIPPVVYLSGVLMFVAGLAIIRAHNRWAPDWTMLVTLSGWLVLALGLFRMFAAALYQRGAANTNQNVFMILEGVLLVAGFVLTFKAYA